MRKPPKISPQASQLRLVELVVQMAELEAHRFAQTLLPAGPRRYRSPTRWARDFAAAYRMHELLQSGLPAMVDLASNGVQSRSAAPDRSARARSADSSWLGQGESEQLNALAEEDQRQSAERSRQRSSPYSPYEDRLTSPDSRDRRE